MQSGFGLLESGLVSNKNQIHIMVKNMTDILFGGLTFWIFGYAFIFSNNSNGFIGLTDFFTDKNNNYGWLFSNFFFQFTFSTTATLLYQVVYLKELILKHILYINTTFIFTNKLDLE